MKSDHQITPIHTSGSTQQSNPHLLESAGQQFLSKWAVQQPLLQWHVSVRTSSPRWIDESARKSVEVAPTSCILGAPPQSDVATCGQGGQQQTNRQKAPKRWIILQQKVPTQACLIRLLVLIEHLCLSGIVCGQVWLLERILKMTCVKKIGTCVQNFITILGSIINIIWGGGSLLAFHEHENLHFKYE